MKLTFANIGWFVGIGALAALSISSVNFKKDGVLTDVDVRIDEFNTGAFFLNEQDVQDQVMDIIVAPENHLISDIQTGNIESTLKANPFIQNANVYVTSDGVLNVVVRQREPILRVFDVNSRTYYIDRTGAQIPVSKHFTARVPVATGHITVTKMEDENGALDTEWTRLHQLILAIDADPFYKSLTEQLDVSKDGQITIVPAAGDLKIKFGKADNIDEKLENLKAFYKQVFNQGSWDTYETIDLSISGQVVCKRKPNLKS
jgi:cell division protein FtsQ